MPRGKQFGAIRKLPSGRFQASYPNPRSPIGVPAKRINAPHTFRTKTDARNWLAKVQTEIASGTWKPPHVKEAERAEREAKEKAEAVTFADYAAEWLDRYPKEGKTWQRHESLLRVHILPKWGGVLLRDIRPRDVRLWLEKNFYGHKATRLKAYETMRTCLTRAWKDELIDRIPLPDKGDIAHPEPYTEPQTRASLTFSDITTLAHQVGSLVAQSDRERYESAVLLMGLAGMRLSEVRGLRPQDIDQDQNGTTWITISETVKGNGKREHTGAPKTRTSRRRIPLPPSLGNRLTRLAERKNKRILGVKDTAISEMTVYHKVTRAAQETGLGHVTPHDLRHSFITQAEYIAPHIAIKAYVGHAGGDMTERYARVTPELLQALADAVEREIKTGIRQAYSLDTKTRLKKSFLR